MIKGPYIAPAFGLMAVFTPLIGVKSFIQKTLVNVFVAIDTEFSYIFKLPTIFSLIEMTIHAGHGNVDAFERESSGLMLIYIKGRGRKSLFGMALCTVSDGFGHGVDDFTTMGVFMAVGAVVVW